MVKQLQIYQEIEMAHFSSLRSLLLAKGYLGIAKLLFTGQIYLMRLKIVEQKIFSQFLLIIQQGFQRLLIAHFQILKFKTSKAVPKVGFYKNAWFILCLQLRAQRSKIRNSLKYVGYKDRKKIAAELKAITWPIPQIQPKQLLMILKQNINLIFQISLNPGRITGAN